MYPGRGGWTWYTGSAGCTYRVGIEAILGLALDRGALRVDPCIPRSWPGYEATLRHAGSEYHVVVENPDRVNRGVRRVEVRRRAIGQRDPFGSRQRGRPRARDYARRCVTVYREPIARSRPALL